MFDSRKVLRCHVINLHKLNYQTDFLVKFGDPVVKSPKVGNSVNYDLLPNHVILLQWQCKICFAQRKFDRSSVAAHLSHHKLDIVEYEADFGGPDDHEELILPERAPPPASPPLNTSQTPLSTAPSQFDGSIPPSSGLSQIDQETALIGLSGTSQYSSTTGVGGTSQYSSTTGVGGTSQYTTTTGLGGTCQFTSTTGLGGTSQDTSTTGLGGTSQFTTRTGLNGSPSAVLIPTSQCTTMSDLGPPSVVHTQTSQGSTMTGRTNWRTPSIGFSGVVHGGASSQSWLDVPPFHHTVGQHKLTSSSAQASPVIPTSEESSSGE